jgi:hypothetical protein
MTYSPRFIEEPPELTPRHAAMFYASCFNTVGDNPVAYFPYTSPFPTPKKTPIGGDPHPGWPGCRCRPRSGRCGCMSC